MTDFIEEDNPEDTPDDELNVDDTDEEFESDEDTDDEETHIVYTDPDSGETKRVPVSEYNEL
jgi:hypothetical protein